MPFRIMVSAVFGLMALTSGVFAEGEAESASEDRPLVTQVGEYTYQIGEIRFDAETREVSIPVIVNMREGGPIEYLLVHENGKVHESIFVTRVSPLHLQIALKLLKYKSGHGDVFNRLLPPHLLEEEGGTKDERGEAVEFLFRNLQDDSKIPAAELLLDGDSMKPMKTPGWIHTGSNVQEGQFMAEVEGSFVAVYLDPMAMFNMTREGVDNDERWGANDKTIPEIGTKGDLVIQLLSE
jgi:hypothetical protein